MAKRKTTITVEPEKLEVVLRLTGAPSTSAAIDIALDRLIRAERLRHDVQAYSGSPPTEEEIALAMIRPEWGDLSDETDWDALYPEDE